MKGLREMAPGYIDLRRALGYKLVDAESLLKDFASFMERENAPYITAKLALLWAMERKFDYVFLLNNDTEPQPDFLKILLEAIQSEPDIGIAGSTREILNDKGVPWIENFGIDLITGFHGYTEKDIPDGILYVVWMSLCSVLIPMEVIQQIGLLDRRMRMYCSDNDYCMRAHQFGYKVVLLPKSKVKHFHQRTTKTVGCYADAEKDQEILIGKLSCQLQKEILDVYPLDWKEKVWGKLEFSIYKKDKNPEFTDAVIKDVDDKISQPATT
jgi:hypothetical protein